MLSNFLYKRTIEGAPAPAKVHADDAGYDLSLMSKVKTVGGVTFYDTGIAVAPPLGYHFELVGRSSISKTGYMLANNIGIIDNGYRGSILVALAKINPDAPELELPVRLVQLIPRRTVLFGDPIFAENLDETERGEGGFGSTN